MSVTIRRILDMGPHVEDLKVLHRAHWDESKEVGQFNFQYDMFRNLWNIGQIRTYGLFHWDRLVGHATAYLSTNLQTGERSAEDHALYVLPEYRTGYGAALWRFAEQQLREEGVGDMGLTIAPDNRIRLLATRMGYRHVSNRYVKRLNPRIEHEQAITTGAT